jgi:hypothetical protein
VYVEDMQGAALELSALGFGVTHMKVDKNGVIFSLRCFVNTCMYVSACCVYIINYCDEVCYLNG